MSRPYKGNPMPNVIIVNRLLYTIPTLPELWTIQTYDDQTELRNADDMPVCNAPTLAELLAKWAAQIPEDPHAATI